MWFNPYAKLAEIAGHPPATSATSATQAQPARPVSRLSQVSQAPSAKERCAPANVADVADVADVATVATPDHHPHGIAFDGRPKTWTGRIVSLDGWRRLTEWERHGPNRRHWNGITKQWEHPKGTDDG